MIEKGVEFVRSRIVADYGTVAVLKDLAVFKDLLYSRISMEISGI